MAKHPERLMEESPLDRPHDRRLFSELIFKDESS